MNENRRPIKTRKIYVVQRFAKKLVDFGITPNQVSVMSVVFAIIGAFALSKISSQEGIRFIALVVLSLICIQLRLVCNLIDGLMAIEGGKKTPTGELYNEIPDRFSDLFLFLGVASSLPDWGMNIGWLAGTLSILTAYIRLLGASMQKGHDFTGPLAKQHRMFLLSLIIIAALIEKMIFNQIQFSLVTGLVLIVIGSFLTVLFRIYRLAKKLNASLT